MKKIPFIDLKANTKSIRYELIKCIEKVIDSAEFSSNQLVENFEIKFAEYCESSYAVGVGSGTDALWLALKALGIGYGDEVVTVPMTFVATTEAIVRTGARPVFVDIDESTYTMDTSALKLALTEKTKAIVPVHLFGQMAKMSEIQKIAQANSISIVEDAAQAHGATYEGHPAGSIGKLGCFSFYPGKNLGAMGEAGAVVTQNEQFADVIKKFRNHGQMLKNQHEFHGWNCRMDEIQAAILMVKLVYLNRNNDKRRRIARQYHSLLVDMQNLILPTTASGCSHVFHVFAVRVPNRDNVMQHLMKNGISCGIHYPNPIHLMNPYKEYANGVGSFPIVERCANEFISLPVYPEMNKKQVSYIAKSLRSIMSRQVIDFGKQAI